MLINTKTVYRHPKGRYEVREMTYSAFGNTYKVREAFHTPDDDRRRMPGELRFSDKREEKVKVPFIAVSDMEAESFAELYRDGVTIEEIAHRFTRRPETVRSHLRRLGVISTRKVGFWRADEIKKAKALVAEGYSKTEVAKKLNRTVSSIESCMYSKRWREA